MQRIVINTCFGGFKLSDEAFELYKKAKKIENEDFYDWEIPRDDQLLIDVIESLGEDANGFCADLKIIEIPDDVKWQIEQYDGKEWVSEVHRIWRYL